MTEGPVGELEELIARAFAQGPETMDVADAATYLAAVLAPLVVLRSQLEHVGWYDGGSQELCVAAEDGARPVFFVPPRVVSGTAHLPITIGMGATD